MLDPIPVRLLEEGEPAITIQHEEPLPTLIDEGGKQYRLEQKMGPESPDAPTAIYRYVDNYIPAEQMPPELKDMVPDEPTATTPDVTQLNKFMQPPPAGPLQQEMADREQAAKDARVEGEPGSWTVQADYDSEGNAVERSEPLPGEPRNGVLDEQATEPFHSITPPEDGILPEETVKAVQEQHQAEIDAGIERGVTRVVESDEDRMPPNVGLETAGEDITDASVPFTSDEVEEFGLVEGDEAPADEAPDDDADLEAYATGGGWYEVDGVKYHGKDAAREALANR